MIPAENDPESEVVVGPERLDTLFSVLSHHRRRRLLLILSDATGEVPVDDLVDDLASREGTASGRSAPADRLERIRLSLEHQHLPKLAHAGLVEWDRDDDVVAATDEVLGAADLVEFAGDAGDR
jgi:hypothetical protein